MIKLYNTFKKNILDITSVIFFLFFILESWILDDIDNLNCQESYTIFDMQ